MALDKCFLGQIKPCCVLPKAHIAQHPISHTDILVASQKLPSRKDILLSNICPPLPDIHRPSRTKFLQEIFLAIMVSIIVEGQQFYYRIKTRWILQLSRAGFSMKFQKYIYHDLHSFQMMLLLSIWKKSQKISVGLHSRFGCCSLFSLFLFLVNSLSISITSFSNTSGAAFASFGKNKTQHLHFQI